MKSWLGNSHLAFTMVGKTSTVKKYDAIMFIIAGGKNVLR